LPRQTPTIHPFETPKVFVMDVYDKRSCDESGFVQIGITHSTIGLAKPDDRKALESSAARWT